MYINKCLYICVYIHIYIHIHTYIHICIYIYVYTYIYTHIYIYMCIYTYTYTYIYTYTYTHIRIYNDKHKPAPRRVAATKLRRHRRKRPPSERATETRCRPPVKTKYRCQYLDIFQGVPLRLPKPLSDRFPVSVCSCPLCIINRL